MSSLYIGITLALFQSLGNTPFLMDKFIIWVLYGYYYMALFSGIKYLYAFLQLLNAAVNVYNVIVLML